MIRRVHLTLLLVFVLVLGACAETEPQSSDEPIAPGDRIGDFLITAGVPGDQITYFSFVHCPVSGETETCTLPVGTKVNVSNSILGRSGGGMTLDEVWSDHTYEMTIEGRPVDLQAFGYIDVVHPLAGTMRNWNVVVSTDKPRTISTSFSCVVQGERSTGTFVAVFESP